MAGGVGMGKHIFQIEKEMFDVFLHTLFPWQEATISSGRLKEPLLCFSEAREAQGVPWGPWVPSQGWERRYVSRMALSLSGNRKAIT